jgi:hypothetical protein
MGGRTALLECAKRAFSKPLPNEGKINFRREKHVATAWYQSRG